MNKSLLILLLVFGSRASMTSDIEVYTKTKTPWNVFLISEVQQLLYNLGEDVDLRSYQYRDEDFTYDETTVHEYLTPSSSSFLEQIENISGLKILDIRPELSVRGVGYKLHNIRPDIRVDQSNERLDFEFDISINGLNVFADSIDLDFVLSRMFTKQKIVALKVLMLKPELTFDPLLTLSVKARASLHKTGHGFEFQLDEVDTSALTETLRKNMDLFNIEFEDFHTSDVSLDIMGRTIRVNAQKIEDTIRDNKADLKQVVVDQLGAMIARDGMKGIVDAVERLEIKKEFWFNESVEDIVPMFLAIEDVSKVEDQILKLDLQGEYCSNATYQQYQRDCYKNSPLPITDFPRPDNDLKAAEQMALQLIKKTETQMVLSVDETYFTKLVKSLLEEGAFDAIKEELEFEVGQKQAFIRFDEATGTADIFIDVLYDVGFLTGIFLTKRNLNFPIHLKLEPRFENIKTDFEDENGVIHKDIVLPHLVFKVRDVNIDHKVIRYGIPEYGLHSTVNRVTFGLRGKVVKKIQKELLQYDAQTQTLNTEFWDGVDLPPVLVPEVHRLKLENVKFKSTGKGRGLFYLEGSDFLYDLNRP